MRTSEVIGDMEFVEETCPVGISLSAKRLMVGKTIDSVSQGDYTVVGKDNKPLKDADGFDMKQATVRINFTDGTSIVIEQINGGVAEDFGDGRGPVRLASWPYMGITQYTRPVKAVCQAVCPKCEFVWNTTTKLASKKQAFCPNGCGVPGEGRYLDA